jgi:hypothetical protein
MEQEYAISAYYEERQVKQLKSFFSSDAINAELKELETTFPNWRRFQWIKSSP